MNKELSETLVTLQNSKSSEIPAFAAETIENLKAEVKRLNDETRIATSKTKEDQSGKTK